MRRQFVAETLASPPVEERIAPGGISSSRSINAALESLRDELNAQRELVDQALLQAAQQRRLQLSQNSVLGCLSAELYAMFQSLLQNSRVLPISWRMMESPPSWLSLTADDGMLHEQYGLLTAPVTSMRSLVYDSDGQIRRDLVLHVATGANEPDGSMWLYTLGVDSVRDGGWHFAVPAGDGGRWVLLRIRLASGGFEELANFAWLCLLPAGAYRLQRIRVVNSSGNTHQVDLAGREWMTQYAAEVPIHWDPKSTGPVDTIELLLRRNGYPELVDQLRMIGVYGFDVRAMRFARSGRVALGVGNRQPVRCEFWQLGSPSGLRLEMQVNGLSLMVSRRSEWYSPMLRGLTIYL